MEIASLILSIIAAGAWIPILIGFFTEKNRKVCANLVDYRIIESAKATDSTGKNKIQGTILSLGINFYIPKKSFFTSELEMKIKLKNNAETNCQLLDGSVGEQRTDGIYFYTNPIEYNFNMHREIIAEKDNVRIIQIMAKNIEFSSIDEIEYVSFTLIERNIRRIKKQVTIYSKDFPIYNRMRFIDVFFSKELTGNL